VSGYLANWRAENDAARVWKGGYRRYDLLKEVTIAIGVVLGLVVLLSVLFSSPDERPSTIAQWSRQMPLDFASTAVAELDGTSGLATYGPPYNHNAEGQIEWFIKLQKWFGVSHPINTAADYVLDPLAAIPGRPDLTRAISTYRAAPAKRRLAWASAYANALAATKPAPRVVRGHIVLAPGGYGPVATLMNSLLALAQSGGLDGALLTSRQFFQTDYTKPLLFLADGSQLDDRAHAEHLLGEQWGMMNETGSYPGQVWLWLYTFWYQIAPFNSSDNSDVLVMTVMSVLSLLFVMVPFLPIVRDIPRWVPIHRLIWRDHYRSAAGAE